MFDYLTGSGHPSSRVAGSEQFFGGEQRIHRPATEAFKVQCDELESQRFEGSSEFPSHFGSESAPHLLARNFDASNVAVVANPELPETELTQGLFSPLDRTQGLASDRAAVFDPRGE